MFKPRRIIIHCSDSAWGDVHEIDKWHKDRGWDGIGYHFVILNGVLSMAVQPSYASNDGKLQFGRPLDTQGAHCRGQNHDTIGICLIGKTDFTTAQYGCLKTLCKSLALQYSIPIDEIYGHNEFSEHKTCPNFDVNEWLADWSNLEDPRDIIHKPSPDKGNLMSDYENRLLAIEAHLKSRGWNT